MNAIVVVGNEQLGKHLAICKSYKDSKEFSIDSTVSTHEKEPTVDKNGGIFFRVKYALELLKVLKYLRITSIHILKGNFNVNFVLLWNQMC